MNSLGNLHRKLSGGTSEVESSIPFSRQRRQSSSAANDTKLKPFIARTSECYYSDQQQAETVVRSLIQGHLGYEESGSFEVTIVPSCGDHGGHIAIVDFNEQPKCLSSLKPTLEKSPQGTIHNPSVFLDAKDGDKRHSLAFDSDFLGLTQLYPTADIPSAE